MSHRNAQTHPARPLAALSSASNAAAGGPRGRRGRRRQPPDGQQVAARAGATRAATVSSTAPRDRGASRAAWSARSCAASCCCASPGAAGRPGSPGHRVSPRRPSTAPCGATVCAACAPSSRASRGALLLAAPPATSSTSTPRSWGASAPAAASASPAPRTATAASAGTTPTSPSTTPPGWPTPRSSPDERGETAAAFLERALAFFAEPRHRGAAPAHRQRQLLPLARPSRAVCAEQGLRHWRTRPYRPQTNGKAEAFVKIVQNGWAYKRPYDSTAERIAALPGFLRLLQWLPTPWRPGRRHTAWQAHRVNNLVMQNS